MESKLPGLVEPFLNSWMQPPFNLPIPESSGPSPHQFVYSIGAPLSHCHTWSDSWEDESDSSSSSSSSPIFTSSSSSSPPSSSSPSSSSDSSEDPSLTSASPKPPSQ